MAWAGKGTLTKTSSHTHVWCCSQQHCLACSLGGIQHSWSMELPWAGDSCLQSPALALPPLSRTVSTLLVCCSIKRTDLKSPPTYFRQMNPNGLLWQARMAQGKLLFGERRLKVSATLGWPLTPQQPLAVISCTLQMWILILTLLRNFSSCYCHLKLLLKLLI